METIMSILKPVTPLTYFTKIDLNDAYYTILVSPSHRKYLKFANNQDLYKSHAYLMAIVMGPENSPKY